MFCSFLYKALQVSLEGQLMINEKKELLLLRKSCDGCSHGSVMPEVPFFSIVLLPQAIFYSSCRPTSSENKGNLG